MRLVTLINTLTAALLLGFGARQSTAQMKHEEAGNNEISKAIAVLHPTKGHAVSGIVTFTVVDNGVRVVADITGLTPGKHGFHVHEFGDCSSDDGSSAGGHFNPTGMPHAMPSSDKRHVGDLGNIEADSAGMAHVDYVDHMITFSGKTSVIGRGVIVHEKEDDLKTQPTGAAGARVACGVIGIAK
jgi:Cu-Zn family superoxide dismutase